MTRGRFAPSPTGPLHFGSLVAAVGSYLHARKLGSEWLVRVEDLDPPRAVPGAAADQLATLERFGFEWDGEILYQSTRFNDYEAVFRRLQADDLVYPCGCSRKDLLEGGRYPGTCRDGLPDGKSERSWRLRTDDDDYIVRRVDGFWAYLLAVVVDDAFQGITHVVRGGDLAHALPRHLHLQRLLGLPSPEYIHLPVVLDEAGEKLSKSSGAHPLDPGRESEALWDALEFLGHAPPTDMKGAGLSELWDWAKGPGNEAPYLSL